MLQKDEKDVTPRIVDAIRLSIITDRAPKRMPASRNIRPKIVFRLDNQRMEQADDQEGRKTYDYTYEIHCICLERKY